MPWPANDVCFSIWTHCYAQGQMVFPVGARVLEIGCAEDDWIGPLKAERPDLEIYGIDWRASKRPAATAYVLGDVLTFPFAASSFDVVVGISSIEHIGLGHYESDPLDVDGDQHCMARVAHWLKPGGWVYADVPFDSAGFRVQGSSYRAYDDATVTARLLPPGCRLDRLWHVETGGASTLSYVALLAHKPAA